MVSLQWRAVRSFELLVPKPGVVLCYLLRVVRMDGLMGTRRASAWVLLHLLGVRWVILGMVVGGWAGNG